MALIRSSRRSRGIKGDRYSTSGSALLFLELRRVRQLIKPCFFGIQRVEVVDSDKVAPTINLSPSSIPTISVPSPSTPPHPQRPSPFTLHQSSEDDIPRFRRVLSERELLWRRALEHTDEKDRVTREELEAHLKWVSEFRADFEKDLGRMSPGRMQRGRSYLADELGIPQKPEEDMVVHQGKQKTRK